MVRDGFTSPEDMGTRAPMLQVLPLANSAVQATTMDQLVLVQCASSFNNYAKHSYLLAWKVFVMLAWRVFVHQKG